MEINEKNIRTLFKKLPSYKVNRILNEKILKAFRNRNAEREWNAAKTIKPLTHFIMNAKKLVAIMATLVLVVSGTLYYQSHSYAYHLKKARNALSELEIVLQGKVRLSWIPSVYAEEEPVTEEMTEDIMPDGKSAGTIGKGGDIVIDETAVADLITDVVESTEVAIEIVEDAGTVETVVAGFTAVTELQEDTIEVLAQAAEVVEDETVMEVVIQALETTAEEQMAVADALETAESAQENGETSVAVNVETGADRETAMEEASEDPAEDPIEPIEDTAKMATAKNQFESAQAALATLVTNGAGEKEVAQLQNKLDKVEAALAEGKYGRVKGLTTAVEAKTRNINRKTERATGKNKNKKGNDSIKKEDTAGCESGFLMFDDRCYTPGENVMDTGCVVSATGGCEAMDATEETDVTNEVIDESGSADTAAEEFLTEFSPDSVAGEVATEEEATEAVAQPTPEPEVKSPGNSGNKGNQGNSGNKGKKK